MEFKKECEKYSIEELELIVETQQDLYTEEEMKCLIEILSQKREFAEIERIKNLPKEIKCPKCDMISSIESERCPYCEFEFGKNKYQYAAENSNNSDFDDDKSNDESNSNIVGYIFSFIIPLVGFILGANLMSKDSEDEKSQGITCIVIGIVSVIVSAIILLITYN